jgi:hypothetical protein
MKRYPRRGSVSRNRTQRIANAVDGAVEVVVEIYEAMGPKSPLQLLARDDCARLFEQYGEYFERLAAELQLEAVFAQFSSVEIKLEVREANDMGGLDCLLHRRNASVGESAQKSSTSYLRR